MMIGGGAIAALLAMAVIAVGLTSSGSAKARSSGCAILDVSESTRKSRGAYTEEFARFATEIANDGTGKLCVILAAADPLTEAIPVRTSVAPLPGNAGTPDAPVEIEGNVLGVTKEVVEILEHPEIQEKGSGLIEAANVAARTLHPGDRLIYLSDGLEWSKGVGHLIKMNLSATGIRRLLTRLKREDLLPKLRGVHVEFPLLLYRPDGVEATPAQKERVIAFWEVWGEATEADLTFVAH